MLKGITMAILIQSLDVYTFSKKITNIETQFLYYEIQMKINII